MECPTHCHLTKLDAVVGEGVVMGRMLTSCRLFDIKTMFSESVKRKEDAVNAKSTY